MDKKEKFWGRNEQNQNFRDLTAPAAVLQSFRGQIDTAERYRTRNNHEDRTEQLQKEKDLNANRESWNGGAKLQL